MNIVLVIIDTLRYDYVGANGGREAIRTPNLDRLAGRSWVFDRAFAASYATIPHRTDVMTGRYGRPVHAWRPLRFDVPTLPRLLAEAGYVTQLIHDTPHLVNGGHAFDWPFHAWTFVRGAEVDRPWLDEERLTYLPNWAPDPLFDFVDPAELDNVRGAMLPSYSRGNRRRRCPDDWNAARLFATASQFLRDNARRENFFLWVDCFDPHEPWDAPPEFVRMYDDTDGYDGRIDPRSFLECARKPAGGVFDPAVARRLEAFYCAKVSWMDHCLGKLLGTLEGTELAGNTAVIITSDHGTNVGERGKFGKSGPIHEAEGHVPLLIHSPGCGAGRSDMYAQPPDLLPTILAIAGAETPGEMEGCDLLELATRGSAGPRRVAIAGSAGGRLTVFGDQGYLVYSPAIENCQLYRYGSTDDIAAGNGEGVEALRQRCLDEMTRRNSDPEVLAFLRGRGPEKLPCLNPAAPEGWRIYWNRNYPTW